MRHQRLIVGVGLAAVRWAGPRFGAVMAAGIVAAAACATVVWPRLAAHALAASQPGILVFLSVLAVRWALQHRYRRRVLFLPGFTRTQPQGSSVLHAKSASRSRLEPSTIDVPATS